MTKAALLGWDVGGAHLKRAVFDAAGTLLEVDLAPCALWRGLAELDGALAGFPPLPGLPSAVTMTGELVDLWPDRQAGVEALTAALAARLGPQTRFYAGPRGFVTLAGAVDAAPFIASANWHATAAAVARIMPDAVLIDMGSTTTDIIPVRAGRVAARGFSDAERLVTRELVYTGLARTPVMALARALPFRGEEVPLMAEYFATSADIHRLTGALPEGADLHAAADNGEKTEEGSARRLLRMVGYDLGGPFGADLDEARTLACAASEVQMRALMQGLACVLSAAGLPPAAPVVGAGVGRGFVARLAQRLGRPYLDLAPLLCEDETRAIRAADCAPAVAVGRLAVSADDAFLLPA
ncbi:S-layer protein [Aquabacter sp. L1I39]|uniref:hydantoinase/oxoprolinase family protein n=1 Tax=Aquabacter sp. L1I39 TaxID=2820278 RepID=UPI001ADBE366|nr:hydantoinase/oxoprolinase family protein [Aquabacter sp. L1I39]QTL03701.1 S-layer protein [Aquabacter sp. L1I39]